MIKYPKTYFNIRDTLDCGQVFRFKPYEKGFLSFSLGHCAYVFEEGENVIIDCDDETYWQKYFDLDEDYGAIVSRVMSCGAEKVVKACGEYKGIRILRQSEYEALISFIISQNNNIPRIKSCIEKVCAALGEKYTFGGVEYFGFPTIEQLSKGDLALFTSLGLGYRAEYLKRAAEDLASGKLDLNYLSGLDTASLKARLLAIKGVGNKVADCALLFGFHKTDSFPVDTWIEKIYHEDFNGTLTDRKKISEYFVGLFGEYSGLVQQYLFHAKRTGRL